MYFYNVCIVKRSKFLIVFYLNVKDNNICPSEHYIRLSYNMLQCFANQNAHVYIKQ